ncbi:unnamed protein product [Closterium sp. NIES-54]
MTGIETEHGPASRRTPTTPPKETSTVTLPLLAQVGELFDEDAEVVRPPSHPPAAPTPPLVADLRGLTLTSANGDEGRCGASPVAPTKCITSGRCDDKQVGMRVQSTPTREEQDEEVQLTLSAGETTTREKSAGKPTLVEPHAEGSNADDDGGEAEESTDSDVVEVQPGLLRTGQLWRLPDFFVPAAFTTVYDEVDVNDDLLYDDAEEDEELPELDPDMHADPKHRWDISTMTVKEALAKWKGKVVKAAMEEEICSLIGMGTWELVERPPGVNIMKNRWWTSDNKLRRHFLDEEQTRRTSKTSVLVDAYAEQTIDDEESQERKEEEYRQKVGSLQFAASKMKPDITFACSKLGSGLTVRSDQHWREVDHSLAYLANTRDTALEFGGGHESLKLVGYVDADDAGDKLKRTSTGGYVFVYGGATVS